MNCIADKIEGKILERCKNKFRTDLSCSLSAITFETSTKLEYAFNRQHV